MKRTVITLFALALVLSGCGGSKSTTAAKASASPSMSPSSAGTSAFSEQCLKAAEDFGRAATALSGSPTADLGTQFASLADQLRAIKAATPSGEVRDAVETLAQAYASFADRVKGLHYTPSAGKPPPPAYLAALQSFSNPSFAKAAQTLGTYFGNSCRS